VTARTAEPDLARLCGDPAVVLDHPVVFGPAADDVVE
jgi:hypothetical protein